MPRGSWRKILAVIFGLTFFGVLAVVAHQLYYAAEQQNAGYSYQPADKARGNIVGISQSPTAASKLYCQNPQNDKAAELCVQWAGVEQVSESNRLTSINTRLGVASLIATAIATLMLIWTLVETRETARRELRAYLYVNACGIVIGTATHNRGRPFSVVRITNSGATPAHRVRHWSSVACGTLDDETNMMAPSNLDGLPYSTMAANGDSTSDRTFETPLTATQKRLIKKGEMMVFVFGAIEYFDAFERLRRTDYRLYHSGIWPPPPDVILRFCNTGNEAT